MGLDSIWKKNGEKIDGVKFAKPLKLIGGMFSGNGEGSFRGKCYNNFISEVTDVSLYQEKIGNEVVRIMNDKLSKHKLLVREQKAFSITPVEFKDLQRMFKTYALAGADLHGWW